MTSIPMENKKVYGSRAHVLASTHLNLVARHRSPELGEVNRTPGSRSYTVVPQRPPLKTRTRSLGELSQVSRSSSVTELGKQYKSLASARIDEIRLRQKFDASELRWQHSHQTYRRTRKLYENAINPHKTNVVTSATALTNLRELFELDRTVLEDQAAEVSRLKQRLEVVQQVLKHSETLFMDAAWKSSTQPDSYAIESVSMKSDAQTLPCTGNGQLASPSPPLDTRLTSHYEKESQVAIYKEQLVDLNYDYHDTLNTRKIQQDRGETLPSTDEDFQARFEEEKLKILQALDQAVKDEEHSKAVCDAAGLDVEAHRSNLVESEDAALTGSQSARQEEYQQPFQESTSLVPVMAFENAELIQNPPSEHGGNSSVGTPNELPEDDRTVEWIASQQS